MHDKVDEDYTEMDRATLEDIITCAAAYYYLGDYAMGFTYTDLNKLAMTLGFESGLYCVFPAYQSMGLVISGDIAESVFKCNSDPKTYEFFNVNYLNSSNGLAPKQYDPRCRSWY